MRQFTLVDYPVLSGIVICVRKSLHTWNNHDQDTDAKTGNKATSVQVRQSLCAGLKSTSKTEDDGTNQNGHSSPKFISHGSSNSSTEEGPSREDGHHSTRLCFGRFIEV